MKRINYKRILLPAMLPAMLFTSCSQNVIEENIPDTSGNGGDICFEINFAPKTRLKTDREFKSSWETYDGIGIFAVRHATGTEGFLDPSGNNFIQNINMTYRQDNGGKWTPSKQLWWPSGTDKLDFYAYYPYDKNVTDPTQIVFDVLADQSGWTNGRPDFSRRDLMIAKADNNGKGYGKGEIVSLTFSHALAMIQLSIPASGKGTGPDEETSVTLKGVKLKSIVNLGGANGPEVNLAAGDNPERDVKMHRVEILGDKDSYDNYTYRALVPAQDLPAKDDLFLIASGDELYQGKGAAENLTLKAGTAELFTRSIPNKLHTVDIKAGTFLMGSPVDEPYRNSRNETQHKVTLTKNFSITKYNITNAQFVEFLNANNIAGVGNGVWVKDGVHNLIYTSDVWNVHWNEDDQKWEPAQRRANYPAMCVTWYGADSYARWVGGALPTEAQWEYACRAGTDTPYSFGIYNEDEDLDILLEHIWCGPNAQDRPMEVGRLEPNPWGLYDMSGNVNEWCSDWYSDNYGLTEEEISKGVTDPEGPKTGSLRSLRGGNCKSMPEDCRSAYRTSKNLNNSDFYTGFRVVFNQ